MLISLSLIKDINNGKKKQQKNKYLSIILFIMEKKKGKTGLLAKAEKIQKQKVQKSPLLTKVVVRVITIILLVFIFAGACHFAFKKITKITNESRFAMVDKQLSYCQELVTVKYRYSDIITLKKSAGFAKSYSIVKYSGILRAGIADIADVTYEISKNGKVIKIKIPAAEILGNELSSQEVFDEKQSIFVPITTQEIFDEIEEARKQAAEDMIADGVLTEAQNYAEKIVKQVMLACGFEEVEIKK